jgi:hypothetical protein
MGGFDARHAESVGSFATFVVISVSPQWFVLYFEIQSLASLGQRDKGESCFRHLSSFQLTAASC